MDKIYSFDDYERAYYGRRYEDCKTIGLYLLGYINNKKAKDLSLQLSNIDIHSQDEGEINYIKNLLSDVRLWIKVHSYY